MSRPLPVALVQESSIPIDAPPDRFTGDVERLLAKFPQTRLVIYPELHLLDHIDDEQLRDAAEPIDGPRLTRLAELAGDLGIWLVPGSVCESDADHPGAVFNTTVALSPQGKLVASYRKIFPWRPYEMFEPGDRFVVFDIPEAGRFGFSICYDAWFPELARHLAWMGAEAIINPVMTTTSDRAQELVLARANAIVNQVYVLSVNAAGPRGVGQSLIVDPEGRVRVQTGGPHPEVLTDVLDLDDVTRVRRFGTAGLNRMWSQFRESDATLELPLYEGRITPSRWNPDNPSAQPS
ncbi:carbon-nitrogen hydrolase family protein [Pseudonocardia spinosispora]|uniref:carbon-nitrogen hydrolase family protein n=1 Tax=Pseudonocardia spinosispora TaxID=103441 RepID=UPI000422075F|nr:carbon-nitrogen hydrolase family protein [Pseudonocardia spinosispora]